MHSPILRFFLPITDISTVGAFVLHLAAVKSPWARSFHMQSPANLGLVLSVLCPLTRASETKSFVISFSENFWLFRRFRFTRRLYVENAGGTHAAQNTHHVSLSCGIGRRVSCHGRSRRRWWLGWRRRHDAWWRSRPHDGRRKYGRSDDAWRPDDRRSNDPWSYDHGANHGQRRPGMERAHRLGRPLP
jgi:hypothetical protein